MTPIDTHILTGFLPGLLPGFPASILAWGFSGWELAILLVLGLLVFGRRLPELGRSVGKTIVEFKKGLAGIESEVNNSTTNTPAGTGTPAGTPAGNQSNQNQNAALPSNPPANTNTPQSLDGVNPYAQGQYRPPQS